MNQVRSVILEYYSNLINEIDFKTEKALCELKNQVFENQINYDRNKIVAKIKDIEKIKLNSLKDSDSIFNGLFCIFISANEVYLSRLNEDNPDFDKSFYFHERIGQLAIINYNFDIKTVNQLMRNNYQNYYQNYEFEITPEYLVFSKLIESKKDQLIIDLTEIENNRMHRLDIRKCYGDLNANSLTFINTCLNVQSIKILEIKNFRIDQLDKNIFQPFKYLTKLLLNVRYVGSLNEEVFNGLENLEILKLYNSKNLKPEANAFKKLINLKELVLDQVLFYENGIFNDLKNLKILVLINSYIITDMNNFNHLQSLETLKMNCSGWHSVFGEKDTNYLVNLSKLKCLESFYVEERFIINPNLEILNVNCIEPKFLLSFKMLKFCKISINFEFQVLILNELQQLEFLDLYLENDLNKKITNLFEYLNFPKLKFLVLNCKNVPKFNASFQNLQGLELIEPTFIPHDQFVNLVSLEYLAITIPGVNMFRKFISTNFQSLNKLKYLKIESMTIGLDEESEELKYTKKTLVKFFQDPKKILGYTDLDIRQFFIEVKWKDEIISEKDFFEKYLQVSERVREFILSDESNYFRDCFYQTNSRQLNFDLNFDDYNDCESFNDYYENDDLDEFYDYDDENGGE
ncbi:unnamed protein product [Brachionus calyciflorus]|uniref:Uncharacterized protein n=1 Tax=Brachionus calyciflorus TaxID=104777 RepID=A0A813R583_9BILA|nr:unnamed protein product [Brachionus calyciflorus]